MTQGVPREVAIREAEFLRESWSDSARSSVALGSTKPMKVRRKTSGVSEVLNGHLEPNQFVGEMLLAFGVGVRLRFARVFVGSLTCEASFMLCSFILSYL